jgi:hypothetical protein
MAGYTPPDRHRSGKQEEMKVGRHILAILGITLWVGVSMAQDPVTAPELQAHKAEAERLRTAADAINGERCTELCLDAAKQLAELSNDYFTVGNVQEGHAAMRDSGRLAQKAGDSSVTSKKRRKQTEIGLRKLEKRIADIAQTLNFEDRPAVQDIVKHIDKVRSDILMSMFDMPKKELGPEKKEKP